MYRNDNTKVKVQKKYPGYKLNELQSECITNILESDSMIHVF